MSYEMGSGVLMLILVLLGLLLIASSFRILREYQRGVVFMLGRFWRVKGPGLVLVIPGVQQMVRVDLRTVRALDAQDLAALGANSATRELTALDRHRSSTRPWLSWYHAAKPPFSGR